ncbi:MAG: hypothetical protein KC933_42045, partial [Myxococcales bacterium]|nr:hypothetical protein [Myxococcales bacterium]
SLFALSLGAALIVGTGCQVGDASVADSNLAAQRGDQTNTNPGPADEPRSGPGEPGRPGEPGQPGEPGEPPPPEEPPPEACMDLQVAIGQCYQDLQPACFPQEEAVNNCRGQVEATCEAARLSFEQCMATTQDPAACFPLEEAFFGCMDQALGACEQLAAGLDACYAPCHQLEAQLAQVCPPPPFDPICDDLRQAIGQCHEDLQQACQQQIDALTACHQQTEQACDSARLAFEQCMENGQDPQAC